MHKDVELNLPHAKTGKIYLEDGGMRVLHVFPDLISKDTKAVETLRQSLGARSGRGGSFDQFEIHLRDSAVVRQS